MKSIQRLAYAALLTISALSFALSQASAPDAAGSFTLTHEVRWQSALVPAGKYRFTIASNGPAEMLTLHNIDGNRATFMIIVSDTEESQPSDSSSILVRCRSHDCFVSAMQLPEFSMTLHFAVPAESPEVAQAALPTTASNAR